MERSKVGLLLAKIEGTYGTDATPAAATDNIAVVRGQVNYTPEVDENSRSILDATVDTVLGVNSLPRSKIGFRVELRGNRTDGTAPDISAGASANAIPIDCLLQACDMHPTYTAETPLGGRNGNAKYRPLVASDQGPSVTIYFYSGLRLHKLLGAKGTFKITAAAGKFLFLDFEFQGLDLTVSDASIPGSATWLDVVPPVLSGSGSVNYDSFAAGVVKTFEFDLGNQITRRDDANSTTGINGFVITERKTKGSVEIEAVAEATKSFFADLKSGKSITVLLQAGSDTGNKITSTLTGTATSIAPTDDGGRRMLKIGFECRRAALSSTAGADVALTFS